jgi:hypothetical protein
MSVTADAGQDDRPGYDERAEEGAPEPDPTAILVDAVTAGGPEPSPPRQPRRRSRPGPRRQAVRQRRPLRQRWTGGTSRLVAGAALLAIAVLVGAEGLLTGWGRDSTTPTSTPQPAEPTPSPEPFDRYEAMLREPAVSHHQREANGPIAGCTFLPSLDALRMRIGAGLVGECVEDALTSVDVDARQRTTNGELIWRRADGRATFTNGADTWLDGPEGVVRRHSHERYAWEPDEAAGPRPQKTTFALQPPLPGAVLPAKRIVSFYGNPLTSTMGILGELVPEQLFTRLRTQANAYAAVDRSRPVVPALELVAVVAQGEPGPESLYRLRMERSLIDRVVGWADQNQFLVILDVQIGRGNVDAEVEWLLPYLKRPNVHLALDPEFAMPPGQVPGKRIGTMDAAAVNSAARTLARLVDAEQLPPKLLVVHRFTEEMVTNARSIQTDPRVQIVMVMDGFGGPSIKTRQFDALIAGERVEYTGFKLFYRHDEPLMKPEQVLLLDPAPDLIIYQ